MTDPYQTPEQTSPTKDESPEASLRNIVMTWEKLRIVYNVIMLFAGIIALIFVHPANTPLVNLPAILAYAIFANACYFAAPVAEMYARVILGITEIKMLRRTLFFGGCALSLIPNLFLISTNLLFF